MFWTPWHHRPECQDFRLFRLWQHQDSLLTKNKLHWKYLFLPLCPEVWHFDHHASDSWQEASDQTASQDPNPKHTHLTTLLIYWYNQPGQKSQERFFFATGFCHSIFIWVYHFWYFVSLCSPGTFFWTSQILRPREFFIDKKKKKVSC